MTGYRALARNHDFTVLWIGQTASELGSAMSLFVFPLVAFALTGSAALAAFPDAAFMLGLVVTLLPGGVLVDRTDRKRLMMLTSAAGVVLYASLAVALTLGALTLAHLVVVALLTGATAGLFAPAEMSAVRAVVSREDLPTALSQNQARQHIAALLGGPLGGVLYSLARAIPFVVDAVSFAISLVTLSRLRTDLSPEPRTERSPWRADLVSGLRHTWNHPYFRTMMVYGAFSNLAVNAVVMVAILRLVSSGVSPSAIGVISALAGTGGILGALAAPYVIHRVPTGLLAITTAWVWAPLLLPLVFWSSPVLVGAMIFFGILLNPAGNAAAQAYRAAITPADLQGRIGAAMQFTSLSMMPLAPVLGGFLLEVYGGPAATVGLLALVTVTALIPTLSRVVRAIPRPAEWPRLEADAPEPAAPAV
ncbi:MAG: major facilitator superfamily 1 [Nocardioides sp.]|nr:major facilitator superfamily 1 [Nocardioides sp.]